MSAYNIKEVEWDTLEEFWENEFPDEYKDETVFQIEPFPKYGAKSITFISNVPEAVKLVRERFDLEKNKSWNNIGSQGLKRLTGKNSEWKDVPLKKVRKYIPMDKDGWNSILKQLQDCYNEFTPDYRISQNGKNKKIRKNASDNLKIIIDRAERIIRDNEEVFVMFCDGSDFDRAIAMDEFRSPRHFDYDISTLISEVRRKIENLEEDN